MHQKISVIQSLVTWVGRAELFFFSTLEWRLIWERLVYINGILGRQQPTVRGCVRLKPSQSGTRAKYSHTLVFILSCAIYCEVSRHFIRWLVWSAIVGLLRHKLYIIHITHCIVSLWLCKVWMHTSPWCIMWRTPTYLPSTD